MAKSYSDDYKAKFMAVFSELVRELTEDRLLKCHGVTHMIDAIQLLKEVSQVFLCSIIAWGEPERAPTLGFQGITLEI